MLRLGDARRVTLALATALLRCNQPQATGNGVGRGVSCCGPAFRGIHNASSSLDVSVVQLVSSVSVQMVAMGTAVTIAVSGDAALLVWSLDV